MMFWRKYKGLLSLLAAALLVLAVYLAAWLPVKSAGFRITVEENGDRAALDGLVVSGTLEDGYEQTTFRLENGEITQHTSAALWREPDFPLSFSASPKFLPEDIREESFHAEQDDPRSGYYTITHTISAGSRLVWELSGFCAKNGSSESYSAQIDTGLFNRTPYQFYCSKSAHFDGTPTQQEIEQVARENDGSFWGSWIPSPQNSVVQSLLGHHYALLWRNDSFLSTGWGGDFALDTAESVAEIDGVFYFVPTVKREWEGKRYIYRLDRAEKWEDAAFRGDTETIGDITPLIEVAGGNMVDLFGLYALPNGTLALCTRNQDSKIILQLYDPKTGELLGESEPFGMYGADCDFFFLADDEAICMGLRSRKGGSTIAAISAEDGSTLSPARTVDFYIRYALWDDGRLALTGETGAEGQTPAYRLAVYGAGQEDALYEAALRTPADGELPLEGGFVRRMPDFRIERSGGND